MTDQTTLRRDLARWAAMSPQAIAEGSPAQFMYAMEDAQHDITALAAEIERLRAILRAIEQFGANNPGCGHSCAKMARDALSYAPVS